MESKILYLAALCCLPTFFYLLFMLGKSIPGWIRRCIPGLKPEDIAQLALVMISVFCFGMSLFLVALLFMSQIPYYHREKSLVIALLFLLMGIICVQVFQFAHGQSHRPKPVVRPPKPGRRVVCRKPAIRTGVLVSNQKS